jgi:hypothetical protein
VQTSIDVPTSVTNRSCSFASVICLAFMLILFDLLSGLDMGDVDVAIDLRRP